MKKVNNKRGLILLIVILLFSVFAWKKFVDKTILLNPISITQRFQEAINTKNGDIALELLAPEAVFNIDDVILASASGEISEWLDTQLLLDFQFAGNVIATDSGVSIEPCKISSDQYKFYGIDDLSGICDFQIEDGFITRFGIQFDESSKLSLEGSILASKNDLISIWETKFYFADAGQIYLLFFADGNAIFTISPDVYLSDLNSDIVGANLTWEYTSNILRVQNNGPASEKFCQEDEAGFYLVKMVGDEGIKLEKIIDPCFLREFSFQLPPRWILSSLNSIEN